MRQISFEDICLHARTHTVSDRSVSGHEKMITVTSRSIDLCFAPLRCSMEDELAALIVKISAVFR